jgi:glycosyltransferase involved in cell wall biosynthesis
MHILEIETFGQGGLTHYAHNLSAALAERGHEVTFVTAAGYELGARDLPANVRILRPVGRLSHRFLGTSPRLPARLARKVEAITDAARVARLARRLQPDVVHVHCTNPAVLFYLSFLRRTGLPLVATAHVVTPHERIPFQEAVYRRVHGIPDLVVAHSEFDRSRLRDEFAVDGDRVVVIPHGEYGFFGEPAAPSDRSSARRWLGLAAHEEVVLFFGYIREYKGLDILLDAWPRVAEARSAARLVVAGDPVQLPSERRSELESHAQRLGAVHRFGYVPFGDVHRYFAAADVLAMPYRHVSQSGVLFLALSLGLPVVATRVGGLPELLRDGDNALLVAPESPGELAQALVRLLGDAELRGRLSDAGRRAAEAHSWPEIAQRTEAALQRIVRD